jgi:RluA family pseudouridine synthase
VAKTNISILYEDLEIIVVNKPSGVSVTADRSGVPDIRRLLAERVPPVKDLRLVHRLDKDTSGVLLLAKTLAAQSYYSRCFAMGEIRKVYLAIVRGNPGRDEGFITLPILKDDRVQKVKIDPRKGKKAKTFYKLLLPMGPVSLLAVAPITGRTHQIRVHFASKGFPLVIDPLYGETAPLLLSSFKSRYAPSGKHEELPLMDRMTLHAYQLTLPLGADKTPQPIIAPLDKKFAATIKMLAKHTSESGKDVPDVAKEILDSKPLVLNYVLIGISGENIDQPTMESDSSESST